MTAKDALETIWYLTMVKIVVGAAMGFVIVGSLYKFKKAIMTAYGILLLSNLVVLYSVLGSLSW